MGMAQTSRLDTGVMKKLSGWVWRYAPSEALGTGMALASASIAASLGANLVLTAVIAAWGEAIGFYLPLLIREYTAQRRTPSQPWALWRILRNLLLEFGAAELLDTCFLRPALMASAMHWIATLPLAIMTGKLTADFFFYMLAITGYELRQKLTGRVD